jgi:hypothetical protein
MEIIHAEVAMSPTLLATVSNPSSTERAIPRHSGSI